MLFLFFFVSLRLDDLTNKSERGKEKQRDRREHNHWQNRVRMDCCLSRHVLTLRVSEGAQSSALRREGGGERGGEREREAEESIGGVFNCHWIPCWRDFKKTIHRKGAEMFGKHLADQYAGESWDGVRSLSLFFFFPLSLQVEYGYVSITQTHSLDTFSIFLSSDQLQIIYCGVTRGRWWASGGVMM